jgi:UDP-N-acetylglucosamine 4,6-dehydratase
VDWKSANVLLTGGTGSFGRQFVRTMLDRCHPRKLVIFSRDELKQHEMKVGGFDHPSLRYQIGDVRDANRLHRAMQGIDVVVHAAALKQVPVCEYNPIEAVETNINGARHVIDAALDSGVKSIIALSSDKAAAPINLYGATKLVLEKLFVQANAYRGGGASRFSCVRYGNVVGSRGSVVPLFLQQRSTGTVTVTDPRMTRFWLTLEQGVDFVIKCIERMHGGEVFIPKIPSMTIPDLVKVLAPECKVDVIGIRPGEKLHEVLITSEESRQVVELEDNYVIQPTHPWWRSENWAGKSLPEGFAYASNTNTRWLTPAELSDMVRNVKLS